MDQPKKLLAKTVQFFKGVELMASKSSAHASRNTEIEILEYGVKVTSFASKRTVFVPWANVTGCELFYVEPTKQDTTDTTHTTTATHTTTTTPDAPRRGRPPKAEMTQ